MQAAAAPEPEQLRQTRQWLERYVRDAKLGTSVSTRVETGDPASAVVAVQRSGEYDLIVLGTNQRKGFERLLIGSVTEDVIREAQRDVLIIPIEED